MVSFGNIIYQKKKNNPNEIDKKKVFIVSKAGTTMSTHVWNTVIVIWLHPSQGNKYHSRFPLMDMSTDKPSALSPCPDATMALQLRSRFCLHLKTQYNMSDIIIFMYEHWIFMTFSFIWVQWILVGGHLRGLTLLSCGHVASSGPGRKMTSRKNHGADMNFSVWSLHSLCGGLSVEPSRGHYIYSWTRDMLSIVSCVFPVRHVLCLY